MATIMQEQNDKNVRFVNDHVKYLEQTLIPDLKESESTEMASDLEKSVSIIKNLQAKVKRMEKAMEGIRFIAFKHSVGYWNDANGTDDEKLRTIVRLAQEGNWDNNGSDRTEELVKKHK